MNVKEYRKQVERELAAARPRVPRPKLVPARPLATGFVLARPSLPVLDRTAVVADTESVDWIPGLLKKLGSRRLASSTRMAAFRQLATATFLGERFSPFKPAYLDAMRQLLSEPQAPPELRVGAISVLAGEKDPAAQDQLKTGLLHPAVAIVPPATALALLSLDDHSDAAPIARQVFDRASDVDTREAALRALSTDPAAEDLLAMVAADKDADRDLRAMGAAALHCLNPRRFADVARNIILDDDDFDDIRATSVSAFANHPDLHVGQDDRELRSKIAALASDPTKSNLKAAAERIFGTSMEPEPNVQLD